MKKLTIGIIIGLMLGMSTNAFAAIGDTVQAVFSQYVYEVNGVTQTTDAPVLVYEGMSYLRTTDLGNMLGFNVTYKADSRTIAFDNPTPEPIVEPTPTEPAPTEPVVTPTEPTATPTTTEPTDTTQPTTEPTAPTTESTTEPTTTEPTTEPATTPTTDPATEPVPTEQPPVVEEPAPIVEPAPVVTEPTNTATCQNIRDSYEYQIVMVGYEGGAEGPKRQKILILKYDRDNALAAAGC